MEYDRETAARNFARWFGRSRVVGPDGAPLVVYHATAADFEAFEPVRGKDAGFHFGTRAQAAMRGGGRGVVMPVFLSASRLRRVRDKGSWTREQIAAAARQGYDGIVYLNRYEGMTTERVAALAESGMLARLDGLDDRAFLRLVPEAEDSYIVFRPEQVKSVFNPGSWDPRDPRLLDGWEPPEPEPGPSPGMRP
jgi:hypothetical protein